MKAPQPSPQHSVLHSGHSPKVWITPTYEIRKPLFKSTKKLHGESPKLMKAEAPVFSIQALKPAMEPKGYNQYLPPSLKEKITLNYSFENAGEINE